MKKLISLLVVFILFVSTSLFSQNVGIGTTAPTNTLHVVVSPTNPNPNPVRFEGIQRYTTEDSVLVVNPATGVVKYMPMADVLSNIPPNVLDSLVLNSVLNNTDTIYNNQSVRDSIIAIAMSNSDTLFSTQIFRDSVLGTILSNMDTIFTITRDSLLNDSTFINTLRDSIDTDIDSVTFANDTIYIYENGTVVQTYINTSLDTALIDSLILASSDTLYSIISDSLTNDTNWIKQIDSLLSIYGDTIYFNDSSYTLIKDSLLNDTAWLNELQDSINTDDQNIDSVTIHGTILTTYIEDGTSASTNLNPMLDSVILSKSDTLYSIISDSLTKDTNWIKQIDSLLSIYGDTIYFNDSSYTLVRDSLLKDSIFLDSLISLIGDSINTDDQNIDSLTLTGTILTTYIEDGASATIDLQPIIDSAMANSSDNDWDINANATGLEAAPAGNNIANGDYSIAAGYDNTASGDRAGVLGGEQNVASGNNSNVVSGYQNVASGYASHIGGGNNNTATGTVSVIVAGGDNTVSQTGAFIGSGYTNLVSGSGGFIGSGNNNTVTGAYSNITGGIFNLITGAESFIGGGYHDTISGIRSVIGGGRENHVVGDYSAIGGGELNIVSGNYSAIAGGIRNSAGTYSSVLGGYQNNAIGTYASIVGGYQNFTQGSYSLATGYRDTVLGSYSGILSGRENSIESSASYSTVTGGYRNSITGSSSYTSVGGANNYTDYARYSFIHGENDTITRNIESSFIAGYNNGIITESPALTGHNFILGKDNKIRIHAGAANNAYGYIIMGNGNQLYGYPGRYANIIGGGANTIADSSAIGNYPAIFGGWRNFMRNTTGTTNTAAIIVGGQSDTLDGSGNSAIVGGGLNRITGGLRNGIFVGLRNNINATAYRSTIIGGKNNTISAGGVNHASIIAGDSNIINNGADNTVVLGGLKNTANNFGQVVLGYYSTNTVPAGSAAGSVDPDNILLKIGNGTDASNLSDAFRVYSSGNVQFNEAYTFPNVDGAANQVLVTDGSGTVTWQNPPSSTSTAISTVTANYSVLVADATILVDASAGAVTVTLPSAVANAGKKYVIKAIDVTNAIVLNSAAGLIDGAASQNLNILWQGLEVQSNGTDWFIIGRP